MFEDTNKRCQQHLTLIARKLSVDRAVVVVDWQWYKGPDGTNTALMFESFEPCLNQACFDGMVWLASPQFHDSHLCTSLFRSIVGILCRFGVHLRVCRCEPALCSCSARHLAAQSVPAMEIARIALQGVEGREGIAMIADKGPEISWMRRALLFVAVRCRILPSFGRFSVQGLDSQRAVTSISAGAGGKLFDLSDQSLKSDTWYMTHMTDLLNFFGFDLSSLLGALWKMPWRVWELGVCKGM